MNSLHLRRVFTQLLILLVVTRVVGQAQVRPVSGEQADQIANLLQSGGQFAPVVVSSTAGACNTSQLPDGSILATQPLSVSKPVYDPIAASANPAVLWPGSLVQLSSVVNSGILAGIPVTRTGGKVFLTSLAATIDPATGRAVKVDADIPQFGAAAVERVRLELLSNPALVGTAQFSTGFASFNSLDELAFKFNGKVSAFGSSFELQLNSAEYRENNNEAILFYQPIYTYTTEDIRGAAAFADGVTREILEPFTNVSNPMGYISSVTYGRLAILTFSSSLAKSHVNALARASSGFLIGRFDAETERMARQAINKSNTHLWVYGFPMDSQAINNSRDRAEALRAAMADSGPMVLRSALPIFYRVNYLHSNEPAAINLSTQFSSSIRSGPPLVDKIKIRFAMGNDPEDNKDWDTSLDIYLVDRVNSRDDILSDRVRLSAHAQASVAKGQDGEGSWQSGRNDIEVPLTLVDKIEWSALNNLSLVFVIRSDGNDHVAFTPTVIAESSSGTTSRSTLSRVVLNARLARFDLQVDQVTGLSALPTLTCGSAQDALRSGRNASSR